MSDQTIKGIKKKWDILLIKEQKKEINGKSDEIQIISIVLLMLLCHY